MENPVLTVRAILAIRIKFWTNEKRLFVFLFKKDDFSELLTTQSRAVYCVRVALL